MIAPHIKTLFKISLITAIAIMAYRLSDLLLIYRYFRFEYYLFFAVLIALVAGFIIAKRNSSTPATDIGVPLTEKLTQKEMDILLLIAKGKSNKEIAAMNFVEISTVKTHINNLYNKLGVSNRREAAMLCHRNAGWQKSTFSPPAII